MNHIDKPALVKAHESPSARAKKLAASFKIASQPIKVWFYDNFVELEAVWNQLPHGGKTELAKDMGVSRRTINRWLSSQTECLGNGTNVPFDPFGETREDDDPQDVTSTGTGVASPTVQNSAISDPPLCEYCRKNGKREGCNDCWGMAQATIETVVDSPAAPPPSNQLVYCDSCRKRGVKKDCKACAQARENQQQDFVNPPPPPNESKGPPLKLCNHCKEWGPRPECPDCEALRHPPKKVQEYSFLAVETHAQLLAKAPQEIAAAFPDMRERFYLDSVSRLAGELVKAVEELKKRCLKLHAVQI